MRFLNSLLALALLLGCTDLAGAAPKPNILFLFADDLSYEALGVTGLTEVQTPNLDRLAKRGTQFTHAYNMGSWNPAVCVASRTMLMTGRSLWRASQVYDTAEAERNRGRFWPELMRSAGYSTYMTGKWHVKANAEAAFDVTRNIRAGMPKDSSQAYNRPSTEDNNEWNPADSSLGGYWSGGKHWSEVTADDAVEFLQMAKADTAKPFFMNVAFNAPHDPRQSPQEYLDKYPVENIKVPADYLPEYPYKEEMGAGKDLRDEKLAPFPRTEHAIKVHRREYYALISHLDAQIGRVLDALSESGQSENTVIIFTADHGLSVGHHGLLGKQNQYDVSTRVPFIVAGPEVPADQKIDSPIMLQDAMATTLELAQIQKPDYVDFNSVIPLLKKPNKVAGAYDAIYGAYLDLQRAITYEGYKLILYPKAKKVRLFNLKADPDEKNDLSGTDASRTVILRLFTKLRQLQRKYDDQLDLADAYPELALKRKAPHPSLKPIEDVPELPRVLIIGDSISMGYTIPVRELLTGKANVHRIPQNGGPTKNGLANIKTWLGEEHWDVIHFNWGLHDLRHMPDGTRQVEPADYEKNLRELVSTMKATGAALIWASTTPVPQVPLTPPRTFGDVKIYNDIASKIMAENSITTDDLNSYITPELASLQNARDVHFSDKGYAFLAKQVASEIEAALKRR